MNRTSFEIRQLALNPTLRVNDPFKRFKPEVHQEVRQADVTGTEIERLRARRQMLQSMDPEQVKQVIEFHKGLNLFEAVALAKREGKLIVPNDVHDRILTETKDEAYLRQNYPVWTGTLVIYEKPDESFGKQVVFEGIAFNVPEQFQGKTNCALVVEHSDFDLISLGNNRYELKVTNETTVHVIEQFAKEDGWYLSDHGIPVGTKVVYSQDARYLVRLNSAVIYLLLRYVNNFSDRKGGYDVFACGGHGIDFKVGMIPLAFMPPNLEVL